MTGMLLDLFDDSPRHAARACNQNSIRWSICTRRLCSGLTRRTRSSRPVKRLRPILMTTFAMLAGMLPLALGIGEAASFRRGMGVAIIGGLIVSTMITLVTVPAVFEYIDMFREFIEKRFRFKNPEDRFDYEQHHTDEVEQPQTENVEIEIQKEIIQLPPEQKIRKRKK